MGTEVTIKVAGVESKPIRNGESTVWKLKDQNGREYATFDGAVGNVAMGFAGKAATIVFTEKQKEKDGRTFTDYYLDSIEEAKADTPISNADVVTGNTDWDLIGLRKTRCALWVAFLQSGLPAQIASTPGDQPASDRIYAAGLVLVQKAETDIFNRPPAEDGDDIPF